MTPREAVYRELLRFCSETSDDDMGQGERAVYAETADRIVGIVSTASAARIAELEREVEELREHAADRNPLRLVGPDIEPVDGYLTPAELAWIDKLSERRVAAESRARGLADALRTLKRMANSPMKSWDAGSVIDAVRVEEVCDDALDAYDGGAK